MHGLASAQILYLTLSKYSLAPFLCTPLPHVESDPLNGGSAPTHPQMVVTAYPEMQCWAGEHWFFVALGGIGLAVYLFGLPCGIALILHRIHSKKLHTDRDTIVAFGSLYSKYEAQAWW